MKKNKTKTNGYTITAIFISLLIIFSVLYIKWWIYDKEAKIDKRQILYMI
ncbi:hypothetical protein [Dysgonomonas sp. ZJ279]|nr:hypothetical protein [Dysgonomonas sp. ZJ279]